jgi:predicted nucleic acid-binding protein
MALGKVGQIHLLNSLYGVVLVPAAVYEEAVVHGLARGEPDAVSIQLAFKQQNLRVLEMNEQSLSAEVVSLPLDRGEKHAIELAIEENADQILLDDMLAREAAKKIGLKVKGTLGVLVDAFRQQFLSKPEIEVIFHALLKRDDIWIADGLIYSVANELKLDLKKAKE